MTHAARGKRVFNGTPPVILIMAIFPQSARSVQYQRRVSHSVPEILLGDFPARYAHKRTNSAVAAKSAFDPSGPGQCRNLSARS